MHWAILDSSDVQRIDEAQRELHKLLGADEVDDRVVLLIIANKQDLPGALDLEQIQEKMQLKEFSTFVRKWHIVEAQAFKGVGLLKGFDWLSKNLK